MKNTESTNGDLQEKIKELFSASGLHEEVPIFKDSYETQVAKTLTDKVSEEPRAEREISDEDKKAIFRFSGYSSGTNPPIS